MRKKKIVYVGLSADILHEGHINILKNAKSMCDKLIVGITTDDLMLSYKKRKPKRFNNC